MRNKLYIVQAWYPLDTMPLPIEYFVSNKQAQIYRDWIDDLQETEQTPKHARAVFDVRAVPLHTNAATVIEQDKRDAEVLRQLQELHHEDEDENDAT